MWSWKHWRCGLFPCVVVVALSSPVPVSLVVCAYHIICSLMRLLCACVCLCVLCGLCVCCLPYNLNDFVSYTCYDQSDWYDLVEKQEETQIQNKTKTRQTNNSNNARAQAGTWKNAKSRWKWTKDAQECIPHARTHPRIPVAGIGCAFLCCLCVLPPCACRSVSRRNTGNLTSPCANRCVV